VFHKKKPESENSSGEELSVYENCLTSCINYYQDVLIKADDLEGLCNRCCVREHDKGTHFGSENLKVSGHTEDLGENDWILKKRGGRAMAQAVSRRSVAAEARVRTHVSPCEICGG
jgi:hypothetical protein